MFGDEQLFSSVILRSNATKDPFSPAADSPLFPSPVLCKPHIYDAPVKWLYACGPSPTYHKYYVNQLCYMY